MNTIQIGQHIFTPEAFAQALAAIPEPAPEKKGALVGTVDTAGVKVGLIVNFGETWHVEFAGKMDWNGDAALGAKVVATF